MVEPEHGPAPPIEQAPRKAAVAATVPARRRVLFVVTEDWYFHSHRLSHAVAAVRAGYHVGVATRETRHGAEIRAAGIELIPLEISRRGFNPLAEIRAIVGLARLYRRYRPDIVHHVALKPVVYGAIAVRFASVPVAVNAVAGLGHAFTATGGFARVLRGAIAAVLPRLLNRRGSRVIVQNPDDRDALAAMGVEAGRIALIPGAGVDPGEFELRDEAPEPVTVTLASRMIWAKGIQAFVDAAAALRGRFPGVRFVLVGKPDAGNPKAVPEAQLRAWADSGVVEWWGFRPDMATVLRQSHIVCLPSAYGEGIPKTLIEAAASGRPIVATDVPGCREVVLHGDSGYLVPPGDQAALERALVELIRDGQRRVAMGRRGRELFERSFSLERVIADTLAVYREALGE
jgi:glycosyltransferase involved in cell wall biosynthesis